METTLIPSPRHWVYEASIRFLRGDDEAAVAAAERSGDPVLTVLAWRAAALANLGRIKQARQEVSRFFEGVRASWVNEAPATDQMMSRWFLQLYPFGRQEPWERLRNGLLAAGMPVEELSFGGAQAAE